MKLILIDGGPASGKNTLGELLIEKFQKKGEKAILLDLDQYVEEFNPKWIWQNKEQEEKDQLNARINFVKNIDNHLENDFSVIAIGERFLTKDDVVKLTSRLRTMSPVFLYHLNVSLGLRKERLHQRGSHTLIDLEKDQKERDLIIDWPGYVYENINSPEEDAENLYNLIQGNKGLLSLSKINK